MQGRTSNPDRARELMANDPTDWSEYRPDILGTLNVGHDGDAYTMAIYFMYGKWHSRLAQREHGP